MTGCVFQICKLILSLLCLVVLAVFAVAAPEPTNPSAVEPARPSTNTPNIVVMFIDDMGYADIGPFGAKAYPTPYLDQMATEGMRFTDFQVTSAVCSASRSALVTGCYHRRIGFAGAFGPKSKNGIHEDEVTIAEICKQKGYATACYGKWHLGHHPKFLPTNHGFDEYFGLPYSNDMWPFHPDIRHLSMEDRIKRWPHLPLIEGTTVINPKMDGKAQELLTKQYTERAVTFIEENKDQPFLVYLPHSMVHVPLYVSDEFKGKSGAGLFGDVVMEVDWSMGQIMSTLKKHNLADNTLVVFTTDNGPWLSYGDHAGSAAPLREGKGTMFEGGCRVPTLMWWPGKIEAGSACDKLASTIDILPTIAGLIGADLPDHDIDGKDISPLMFGEKDAESPHEYFYHYYSGGELQAVRDQRWKLFFPHRYRTMDGNPGGTGGIPTKYSYKNTTTELYDLQNDWSETTNVADDHPEIVERLKAAAEVARGKFGDKLTGRKGNATRPLGKIGPGDELLDTKL